MKYRIEEYQGKRIGRLTITSDSHKIINGKKKHFFHCKCDCGKEVDIISSVVASGNKKSCGFDCLLGDPRRTSTPDRRRLHRILNNIKSRCNNPNTTHYDRYGGRGISVCKEWLEDSELFINWAINNGYANDLTIDRIDNSVGYSPDNCRWVGRDVQSNNRDSNVTYSYNGETMNLTEWSKKLGVNRELLRSRLRRGWSFTETIETLNHD
jgi:hypothetical protein